MLTSRILRHPPRILRARLYTSKAASAVPKAVPERVTAGTHPTASSTTRSSCPPNTILVGLNYLKDQPPSVLFRMRSTHPGYGSYSTSLTYRMTDLAGRQKSVV
ncbi:hypothetical protein BGW80DRAFT_329632 [Lactifluus volemus]|nr:hypothetical protein BGW80DRAFT_329632 [Lactifluus volemus]